MNPAHEYRSVMFVPGSSEKMIAKAGDLKADLLILDLEDSVHPDQKPRARQLVSETTHALKRLRKRVGVRVNDLSSSFTQADLEAVLPSGPDVLLFPKVVAGDDLVAIDILLGASEVSAGLEVGSTEIMILAGETPGSLLRFDSLTNISDRLVGMTWGAEDLASELGATDNRTPSGDWLPPFQLAQTLCLAKARDLNIQAIDTVYADTRNLDGLRNECDAARQLGFTGKLAIHPAQLAVINEAFSPCEQEVANAERIIALFGENPGAGALPLDGRMVDIPHLRAARRVLSRHRGVHGETVETECH